MPKSKFRQDYHQMLEQKLGGATQYEEMKGKKKELASIAQQLRQTMPRFKQLR